MTTETLTAIPSGFEWITILNDAAMIDAAGGLWTEGRTGNRWQLILTYENVHAAKRRDIWGAIWTAHGQRNRIRVPLSLLDYARTGAGGGTPTLSGAVTAGGTSLPITGGPTSQSQWLARGDFVRIGNELKGVKADVATDGAGAASIPIFPELHQNYASATAVDIATPHGDFFVVEARGMGAVAALLDDSLWLNPQVVLTLEEDVRA